MRRGSIVYSRADWKRRDSGHMTVEINIDVDNLPQLESARLHMKLEEVTKAFLESPAQQEGEN